MTKTAVILVLALSGAAARPEFPGCTPSTTKQNEWACHSAKGSQTLEEIANQHGTHQQMVCDWNINTLGHFFPGVYSASNCSTLWNAGQVTVPDGFNLKIPPTCVVEEGIHDCAPFQVLHAVGGFTREWIDMNSHLPSKIFPSQMKNEVQVRVPWTLSSASYPNVAAKFDCRARRVYSDEAAVFPFVQPCELDRGMQCSYDCHSVRAGETLRSFTEMYGWVDGNTAGNWVQNQPVGSRDDSGSIPLSESMKLRVVRGCIDSPGDYFCYKVTSGMTMFDVSAEFAVSQADLHLANRNMKLCGDLLCEFMWMKIPLIGRV